MAKRKFTFPASVLVGASWRLCDPPTDAVLAKATADRLAAKVEALNAGDASHQCRPRAVFVGRVPAPGLFGAVRRHADAG